MQQLILSKSAKPHVHRPNLRCARVSTVGCSRMVQRATRDALTARFAISGPNVDKCCSHITLKACAPSCRITGSQCRAVVFSRCSSKYGRYSSCLWSNFEYIGLIMNDRLRTPQLPVPRPGKHCVGHRQRRNPSYAARQCHGETSSTS